MADPFNPRFVDLVRNYTDTVGTGNLVLGDAPAGFTSFASALAPGDTFYYSIVGLEKLIESEVGRGTLQADGSIARDPIGGALTNFSSGSKSVALVAAAEWFTALHEVRDAPASAADRTELASLSTSRPALLLESGREGVFVFDSGDLSAKVATDPAQGVYVAPGVDPTGAAGAWVRKLGGGHITPAMFGAEGGYNSAEEAFDGIDDTGALQALLDFWRDNPEFIADLQGQFWTVSSEITIRQVADDSIGRATQKLHAGTFVGKTGSTGIRLVTVNFPGGNVIGKLGAIGPGNAIGNCMNYADRSWDYGITLIDCRNMRMLDGWYAANFKRWGLYVATEDFANLGDQSNGGGSNIAVRVGPGKAFNCGSAAGQLNGSCLTYTFDSVVFNGGQGSSTQTCSVHFVEPLDPKIQADDDFTFTESSGKRTAYTIKAIDFVANTIEFYFWLPSTVTAGTMDSAHGGFLCMSGGNSGESSYGPVSGLRAGVGLKDDGLYGSYVGSIHTEASGINCALGKAPNGASYGGRIEGQHAESTYLDIYCRGISEGRRIIGPSSARGVQTSDVNRDYLGQVYQGRPRFSDDTHSNTGSAGLITTDEYGWLSNEGGPPHKQSPAASVTISNRPHERYYRAVYPSAAQTITVTFDWYEDYADLWTGKHWMGFELFGAGESGSVDQLTVQLTPELIAAGFTLNGGSAPLDYPDVRGPVIGRAVMDLQSRDLRFSLDELELATPAGRSLILADDSAAQRAIIGVVRGVGFHCAGLPAASEVIGGMISASTFTIDPQKCACKALAPASAAATIAIRNGGMQIGSFDFAAGASTATVAISAPAISEGDQITFHAPDTIDSSLADIDGLVRE